MATSKKFSELPVASSMNNGDLFAVAQEDAQAETGYTSKSATALVVGKKLNGEIEYATDLPSFPPGDQNPLDALEYLNSKINDLYPVDSASGSTANFTTSLALPLVALKAYIKAQGGGGTPTTPVPITGFSSITLTCADEDMQTVDTFTLPLGQTVYGGYVDWELGKLVIDKAIVEFDGTEDWSIGADGYARISKPSVFPSSTSINIICNMAIKTTQTTLNVGEFRIGNTNLIINLGTFADVTELKTWLSSNELQFLYPLATPIEIDLSTTMPQTIEGVQNWFADSGDIELEYKIGVQEYIDKKIAEVQALVL